MVADWLRQSPLILLFLLTACTGDGGVKSSLNDGAADTNASQAVAGYDAASSLSETQRAALDGLLVVMKNREWRAAEELVQSLLVDYPEMAELYANLGTIYFNLNEHDSAEQAWLKALQIRNSWPSVSNRLGVYYRQQGRLDDAFMLYQQALEQDAQYSMAHRNVAILYEIYRGDYDKAYQHYQRYAELVTDDKDKETVKMWIADLERRMTRKENE
ncbi:MAG: tetratricopeptide repeat protein [Chromatiales bacterium]|nr:tetratricopeptide repeat protein [Chromatiales bacterium]